MWGTGTWPAVQLGCDEAHFPQTSSLFYENMHSNGLRDPGGKAVADSLSTWHSDLFYRGGGGGTVTKAWPKLSKGVARHPCVLGVWAPQPRVGRVGGICYQAHSNCFRLFPSLRTPSVMSKQAFAVRQGERELGCLWQMETIRVSLFHGSCGRNFSMLLPNRSKRCQRVRDEVSTVFTKLRRWCVA